MLRPLAAALALLLAACSPSRTDAGRAQASTAPPEQLLLDYAAADFRVHGPPGPLHFRGVRGGRLTGSEGTTVAVLCGEFRPAGETGEAGWTPFATVRTTPYEHWLGAQAADLCRRATLGGADLSPALQRQLGAGR